MGILNPDFWLLTPGMTHMRPITFFICLVSAWAGCYLLESTVLAGAQQQGSNARPSLRLRRAGSTKPTWHSGPASTPPDTEIVPPPPPNPPPVTTILESQEERAATTMTGRGAASSVDSVLAGNRASAVANRPTPAVNAGLHGYSNVSDPETLRIREDLKRLQDDTEARRVFYDELRHTVERVRAGMSDETRNEGSPNDASSHPESSSSPDPSSERSGSPTSPPTAGDPHGPPPENPGVPRASFGQSERGIERAAYVRVIRWAKVNGAPVPLALGVAWMESHLHTAPPRGNAGEVGTFQIMPARCRLEGWPSARLSEPEFNAWLGTRLLARYYQEEGSWARAAAKYVAGPRVFDKSYSKDAWAYINWYASAVNSYAGYFSHYQT
jgi:hypothetical protein